MEKSIERQWLYEAVWSKPVSAVAEDVGISGTGLAKICTRMNVPRPPRGYWAKIRAGRQPKRASLPKRKRGTPTVVTVTIRPRIRHPRTEAPPRMSTTAADDHPLVRRTRHALEGGSTTKYGRARPKKRSAKVLDVSVAPASLERALKIFGLAIGTLESRGHRVTVEAVRDRFRPEAPVSTFARIGEQTVRLAISERSRRTPHKATKEERLREKKLGWLGQVPKHDYVPSGILTFEVHSGLYGVRDQWSDTKRTKLEDRIPEVVAAVERASVLQQEAADERERAKQEREAARQRAELERRRNDYERRLEEDLVDMVERHDRARRIRSFVAAAAGKLTPHDLSVAADWFQWAKDYADRTDPLTEPGEVPKQVRPKELY
jgi:hypothetical protein